MPPPSAQLLRFGTRGALVAPSVPTAPGTPSGIGRDSKALLSWSAALPNGSVITGYVITPYIGGMAQPTTTVGNVGSATVTGLTNGTAYTFKVHAVNGVGAGPQSGASASVTPEPFIPSHLASLAAWFKATAISGVDGDPVGLWPDSSSFARAAAQGTAGAKPTLKTNILNGLAVVRFDGDDYLQQSAFTAIAQPTTIFVVNKFSAATGTQTVLDGASTSTRQVLYTTGGSVTVYAGIAPAAVSTTDAAWHIHQVTFSGVNTVYRRDGGAASAPVSVGSLGFGGLTIGAYPGLANFLTGDVAETVVCTADLSLTDLNDLGTYFASRYALTWNTAT